MQIETRELKVGDRTVVLIGSDVVTSDSLDTVDRQLRRLAPDSVVLDYDATRWRWLGVLAGEGEVDLVEVIRAGEMSELNARLAMGVLGKSISPRAGVPMDAEFVRAHATADSIGAHLVFGRRPVEIEALRGWRKASIGGRFGVAWRLFLGSLRRTQLDGDAIAQFDAERARADGVARAGQLAPVVFDEAAAWMAHMITDAPGGSIAVVTPTTQFGAIEAALQQPDCDVDELDFVPPKSLFSRAVPWLFTGLIIAAFVLGFVYADPEKMHQAAVAWFASNMIAGAIGALLALAHPVTILATSISAPFVSLNPAIGAGMVGALVQAFVVPPTVRDMDRVGDDITRLRGWWQNRLARLVLIFVFANLFSSIGSFAAFAWFPAADLAG